MMTPFRRNSAASVRFAERRQREDEAPRLREHLPRLVSLKLEIVEDTGVGTNKHVRHVVLDRAPALFLFPCGDPRCVDGEHDLTATVMRALDAGQTSFHGDDDCTGSVGSAYCSRVLHVDGTAEYAPRAAPEPMLPVNTR
jgi:hypothetical protein